VVIAVQNTREMQLLCGALGVPELADDPRFATNDGRVINAAALDAAIAERTTQLTSDDLIERLEAAALAWGRVNDLFGVMQHPQLAARERWADVPTPNGPLQALRPPLDITGVEVPMKPVPSLGQHTAEVLAWLGLPVASSEEPTP
jgi:crotonobetainyl-CoA:carnitine CoA-transferase CaiB-like acyl-CoA transferase